MEYLGVIKPTDGSFYQTKLPFMDSGEETKKTNKNSCFLILTCCSSISCRPSQMRSIIRTLHLDQQESTHFVFLKINCEIKNMIYYFVPEKKRHCLFSGGVAIIPIMMMVGPLLSPALMAANRCSLWWYCLVPCISYAFKYSLYYR